MSQTHLSQNELKELRKNLEEELKTVGTRIQELQLQDPFFDPDHANDNAANDKEAQEEEGHDRIGAQLQELTNQKQAVEKSLKKMEEGTYGICEATGLPIPKERLFAYPTATTIVLPEKANS